MISDINKSETNEEIVLPMVSICTPTFNRRPFIPYMIQCFEHQTYPKERIEWIIVDDGTDSIRDLVEHIPQVKYFYYEEHMVLGKKRNLMHSKCVGDILIYMDDDDYYPPQRIEHAVEVLNANPSCLIAGSSEMHIYYDKRQQIYQCGPYRDNHATAATFAFRKELLIQTSYNEDSVLAEEKHFLKNYTIPMVQLDTQKTILVFSHSHNSLNKEKLLEHPEMSRIIPSRFKIDDFITDTVLKDFYVKNMNEILIQYQDGIPEKKPRLMKALEEVDLKRIETIKNHQQQQIQQFIQKIQQDCEKKIQQKDVLIKAQFKKIKELQEEIRTMKESQHNDYNCIKETI